MTVLEQIEAWEMENLGGEVPGTSISRQYGPSSGVEWAVGLGPMRGELVFGAGATVEEAFAEARERWNETVGRRRGGGA